MTKYIISCPKCHNKIIEYQEIKKYGTLIKIEVSCNTCHETKEWSIDIDNEYNEVI